MGQIHRAGFLHGGIKPNNILINPKTLDLHLIDLVRVFHVNFLSRFIDDLQWCDTATFDLIENLFINFKNHPYLFLLGAYRNNEVDGAHLLRNLVRRVKAMKSPVMEIRLKELEPVYTNEMVAYILGASSEKTDSLSGIVHAISEGGNG